MLNYDLQVLGLYFENTKLLKFLSYIFSTLIFLYLGIIFSKKEKNIEEKYKEVKEK